jgi:ribose 5-phosphate isomerase B
MKIAIGADHAGYRLKEHLIAHGLSEHQVVDVGTHSEESTDYPIYAFKVARLVASGEADLGVLICGTGIGMSMAASRVPGARPALCTNQFMAQLARAHNNANILCLGGRVVGPGLALAILEAFLTSRFAGGRHQRRVRMVEEGGAG